MTDTLQTILAAKRDHVAACKLARPLADIERDAAAADHPRGFLAALDRARAAGRFGLIAEIKKAPALAAAYKAGGATCLSVLTDEPFFQGADRYLRAARAAVDLPVLRKDFMIDPYQVVEARALGADCILLIMAALSVSQAKELEAAAMALGMDVLVEVHDRTELEQATELSTRLLGINNRNLKTLTVDIATSIELAGLLPQGYTIVGESGLKGHADLVRLAGHGIGCFLVGESLMLQDDVTAATRRLLEG
jgi:indole-3-glycerol phosphate synthase